MTKIYASAAIVLFWVMLSTSLMRLQLAASPVYKMRMSSPRSIKIQSASTVQVKAGPAVASYN